MSRTVVTTMRCGNCGADVEITSPATVHVTCAHCGSLNVRGDVDLKSLGEVALPAPLASNFQIGTEGTYGWRPFVVRGQIQLDHGAGLWNEWAAETDEGWIWIAEAQGEVHVYEEVEGVPGDGLEASNLPDVGGDGEFDAERADRGRWHAGQHVTVGKEGVWTITEIGRGRVVTCRGEFPIEVSVGERTTYVDIARGTGGVGTLDFTRPGPPEVLLGKRVLLPDLALDPSSQPEHTPHRIESESITCDHCGGTIEVQDPEHALTLGCVHCGTILSRERHVDPYAAALASDAIKRRPTLPIGTSTSLRGEDVTVIGYMRRGVLDGGTFYPWEEYLLRTADGAYRWLVESDGHWVLATPTTLAAVSTGGGKARFAGNVYRHFSGGMAKVDAVLGEFYWRVRAGDEVRADDYVDPKSGTMVSLEVTMLEGSASRSVYVPTSEMEAAFPEARLPRPRGVGAAQPNPIRLRAVWQACLLLVVLLMGSCVAVRVHHANEEVHSSEFGPTSGTKGEEVVQFSDSFTIRRDGANARVTVHAPGLEQGYLDVLGALVNETTGDVITFTTAAQRYSGVSGGESWSEGNRKGRTTVGRVPEGTYRMRIASRGYDAATNRTFTVSVRSQVPGFLWFVLAFFPLLAWPVVQSIRVGIFETARWSKSDHAG